VSLLLVIAVLVLAWGGVEPVASWWLSGLAFAKDAQASAVAKVREAESNKELHIESDILEYSNAARAEFGVPLLVRSDHLDSLASAHCHSMATSDRLSHDGFDQRAASARSMGLLSFGENCAEGYYSGQSAVSGWMDSPGHKANILDSAYRLTGIAYEDGYAVQVFGG